jgi:diaminohydroxyphosphoribosylaminopyrimidine deaminase/5-amino-6-(5-phosphoribosylamino)uracil reductase
MGAERDYMRMALRLAQRGYRSTSPNPMVGAVLIKKGRVIGKGWHQRAGEPHAEIEALQDARKHGHDPAGATLFLTLEPCSSHGRTPPCTEAIISADITRVVAGATDPNPRHRGYGFTLLKRAGVAVSHGLLREECERLNEAFNHWIVHRTPFVTVKSAMTLDGKIATVTGESKWITGETARNWGMKLRQGADAILVGINTVLKDDPSLTFRIQTAGEAKPQGQQRTAAHRLRRIVLDSMARTPLDAKVVKDKHADLTTIVVSKSAPRKRVQALANRVRVVVAPTVHPSKSESSSRGAAIDLRWLLKKLGSEQVTSLLVEGGGEVNASFLLEGLAHRVAFFYAPKVFCGANAPRAVAGNGAGSLDEILELSDLEWRRLDEDWLMTARVAAR